VLLFLCFSVYLHNPMHGLPTATLLQWQADEWRPGWDLGSGKCAMRNDSDEAVPSCLRFVYWRDYSIEADVMLLGKTVTRV